MKLSAFTPVLLLASILGAAAAETKSPRPGTSARSPAPNPPDTDFSTYPVKGPWVLSDAFLAAASARRKESNFYESKIAPYVLPPLFTATDGRPVATAAEWDARRRPELLALFREHVYGVAPPRPPDLTFRTLSNDPAALGGRATLKRVAIEFRLGNETFSFPLTLFVPKQRRGPAPVFLLLNHRSPANTDPTRQIKSEFWPVEYAVSRGYAMAAINVADEVDPDHNRATTGVRVFYHRHPEAAKFTWATISAWAWAGSRAVDYFETDPDLDRQRIAVIGHSRTGKTSLWAAAQDPRFALACVNDAGESGPALARRNFGETVEMITRSFPYWFTPKYATYARNVAALPVDQHQLVALVAPRGYHGADATEDLHADPRGSWLALVEASAVWARYGKASAWHDEMPRVNELRIDGPLAYHLREGGHALTTFDWKLYFDHADQLFRRG
ncbi:MAG: acetylxylan esterase [Verrucomicrobia bacterium]|nr:acetylxylan esterase [Verrucomicrobiota bacterium]